MYANPARIRKHVVKIRLDEDEHRLLLAFVGYSGGQLATVVRELAIQKAEETLSPLPGTYEGAISGSIRA